MGRNIKDHKWVDITSEQQFNQVLEQDNPRVIKGLYEGPGRYMFLNYIQRCPRNCCNDNVNELISESDAKIEIEQLMSELGNILPQNDED